MTEQGTFGDLRGMLQYVPQFRDRTFAVTCSQAVGIDQVVTVTVRAFRWRGGSLPASTVDGGTFPGP